MKELFLKYFSEVREIFSIEALLLSKFIQRRVCFERCLHGHLTALALSHHLLWLSFSLYNDLLSKSTRTRDA